MIFFSYLILGCLAAFLSGLLGIGGGMVLVPGLAFIFSTFDVTNHSQLMHISIGTSLASSIVNLIISTRTHHLRSAVKWPIFKAMSLGVFIGALLLGPMVMLMMNEAYLQISFGIFCLFIFMQLTFLGKKRVAEENLPSNITLSFLGLLIGGISTVLGIAGGAMVGAMLHHYHVDARKVVGTSASVSIVIAISGTLGLLLASHSQPDLPKYSTGYIYWPAFLAVILPSILVTPLGAVLAHKLPVTILKKLFGGLILIIGLKMLLGV